MMQNKSTILTILVLLLLLLSGSVFTVYEANRGIVLRLGKLVVDDSNEPYIFGPGLHFKWPLISRVVVFDKRLQTLEIEDSRIVTKEKKDVIVSLFIKWRINDFALFYKRSGGIISKAETLLRQKVSDGLRAEFGRRTIRDVVSGERVDLMRLLQESANKSAYELGIAVIDVRIKRIDLPVEVSDAVFSRMRAEREQAAAEHRADGHREAETIRANADAKITVMMAEAQKQAKTLRGQGDANAAKVYSDAYTKNAEFYAFYRSLRAYNNAFSSKDDLLVIGPDSEFFRYFNTQKGLGKSAKSD